MLRLNELNVETLQFLKAEQRDPVLFTSRRCSKVVQRHQALMSLRNLNLEVEYLGPNPLVRFRLLYAPDNLPLRRFERTHVLRPLEGLPLSDPTDTKRRLEAHLRDGWISYVTLRTPVR